MHDDRYRGEIPKLLPAEKLREISRIRPELSWAHILAEWAAIVGAIWACQVAFHPALYLLCVVWIGARQHALLILVHEGAHYRLFNSRWLNDWVSEGLLAWPLLGSTRAYRETHWAHHRHVNTEHDPDWMRKRTPEWEFPMRPGRLAGILIRDVTGLNLFQYFPRLFGAMRAQASSPRGGASRMELLTRLAYMTIAIALLTHFGLWKTWALYWAIPSVTWLKLALRIRSIAEHFGLPPQGALAQTRTTLPSLLERWFLAPKNIGYHLEHHLFPGVPFHQLPKVHRLLRPVSSSAHATQSYLRALRECVRPGLT